MLLIFQSVQKRFVMYKGPELNLDAFTYVNTNNHKLSNNEKWKNKMAFESMINKLAYVHWN